MKRVAIAIASLAFVLGATGVGEAQPPPPGLPPGHPPLDQPRQPVPPRPSAKDRAEILRRMQEQAAARGASPAERDAAHGAAKPITPKDAHGFCPGHGVDERPHDINLAHGWLAVDNAKAEPPPVVPRPVEGEGVLDAAKRMWPYWKWQITPYPYRYQNHADECDRRNQPVPLLANLINLGALVFLFLRFGKKPLREGLRRRRDDIMAAIDEARELKLNAKKRLEGYENDLERIDDKLVALREQYRLEGEVEEKRVREDATDARRRLLADADFRISQESKGAREALSRQALEQALAAAERLLSESVSQADHDRLAQEYLDQVGPALRRSGVADRARAGGAS